MELFVCLISGLFLIVCGGLLFQVRQPNWHSDGEMAEHHRQAIEWWGTVQRTVRFLNNSLLMLIGVGIMAAGFVPHGRAWMLLWGVILVTLLFCILFAMVDALSSMASYRQALPEAARRSFGDQHDLSKLDS